MFKRLILYCVIYSPVMWAIPVLSQQANVLVNAEKMLQETFSPITEAQGFSQMEEVNSEFIRAFKDVLLLDSAFFYPFDSLVNIGKQTSPDGVIRLFTWNIPGPNRTQKYFGLVVLNLQGAVSVFEMIDKRGEFAQPHTESGSPEKWFGALYYEIVQQIVEGETYYVLLGVDLNNAFSSKRIIDVLSIGENGSIIFGKPIFRLNNSILSRVVFEYSARATMVLRWDKIYGIIVFNSLTPLQPAFAGNYQYYVPDAMFNGFSFDGAYWNFVEDIDVRNPLHERKTTPTRTENNNFDPGFLYRSGRKTDVQ
ncbi:MAG: hypothetical protein RBR40_11145 [Tenuifilaceae bacterium]|nr:hypothetical protein [Tenuifilaceae bacterium]